MKHIWLIPLLLLTGCANSSESRPNVFLAEDEFAVMCWHIEATTEYECGNLPTPIVVISGLITYFDMEGVYYNGEDILYIGPQKDTIATQTHLILHEAVHYILWMRNIERDQCKSEALARQWTAEVLDELVDPMWRERYDCKLKLNYPSVSHV